MIKRINKGQAALMLILLTAAALIFLAITLNWGRIAQTKALLSVAADQGAALLASDAASYGEMQKQTYLNDTNQVVAHTGVFMAILMIVVAIIVLVITVFNPASTAFALALVAASVAMSVINLVLQVAVLQPGITSLWNKLQKNQPIPQQFYEQGLATALQGAVTDQVEITDFFDLNANGIFGLNKTTDLPKDSIGRFGFFYTDRLKMLNQQLIPQVVFFADQLQELMDGETCAQNENDVKNYPLVFGAPLAACLSLNPSPTYCVASPDPACQAKIPNGFQLNDTCTDLDPASATYNPYCDPCCQLLTVPGSSPPKPLRPPFPDCPTDTSAFGAPAQCWKNNPFGGSLSQFTLLYDPSYQEYANNLSFLDQFGRDQQMGPFSTTLTPQGNFPNGVYPFFWLMKDYSPEVDNINAGALQPSQYHWCTTAVAPAFTPPAGFPTLTQLGQAPYTLPYSCVGQDCCVQYLFLPGNGVMDMVGSPAFPYNPILGLYNPATDPSFGEGSTAPNAWLEGDNQMCLASWTYNGSSPAVFPDGTCEWTNSAAAPATATPIAGVSTVDALDDTMHTLSDFVNFSYSLLHTDVGTLSATFDTWYSNAADWIDPASNGRLLSIYDPYTSPPVNVLGQWSTVMTSWLNTNYTSVSAWCLPAEATVGLGTFEDAFINATGGTGLWGDLSHVIACENYNSYPVSASIGTAYNYQECQSAVSTALASGVCLTSMPGACSPVILNRSLAGPSPVYTGTFDALPSCVPASDPFTQWMKGTYLPWVTTSLAIANDEAPKFALRAAFLQDINTRAQNMLKIFQQGDYALMTFLAPCSGANCSGGGPAAQLTWASTQPSSTVSLPNAVIYGWQDDPPGASGGCTDSSGNKVGCSHIVKVTAYAPGRNNGTAAVLSRLPWIQTKTSGFLSTTRSYTLEARDGPVYVKVDRWDQDHNPISFPNTHTLWQTMFHNPKSGSIPLGGSGISPACINYTTGAPTDDLGIGLGLTQSTVDGLTFTSMPAQAPGYGQSVPDKTHLSHAFMLNDEGDGRVDGYGMTSGTYNQCLCWANAMLASGQESHACMEYIASSPQSNSSSVISGSSGTNDVDYSLKFVDCNSVGFGSLPEDLMGACS